ncbi:MAG: hypothetical protein WA970_18370, partial [Gammaproteobacteria bacterium]
MSRDDEEPAGPNWGNYTHVMRCHSCGSWQLGHDCYFGCVANGCAEAPMMVNVPGRESELCRHAEVDFLLPIHFNGHAQCRDCGNEVEPVQAAMSPNEEL